MDNSKFSDVDCFIGCGNGILKALSFAEKQFVNLNQVQISNCDVKDVTDLCSDVEQNLIYVAHTTGVVNAYNIRRDLRLSDGYNAEFTVSAKPPSSSNVSAGSDSDDESDTENVLRSAVIYEGRLICCWKNGELVSIPLSKAARKKLKDKAAGNSVRLLANAGRDVERMRQNSLARRYVAVGGRENELKIYDVAAQKVEEPIFTARNVPHDSLNLRVPVFVKDMTFLDEKNRLVTASANRRVRLYDPSSGQKRPVSEITFGDDVLTTIAGRPDRMQVIVGNGKGRVGLIDFRQPTKLVRCYKGFVGSVRTVQVDEANSHVISGGLDRFVFAHNIDSGLVEHRVFVKSQVNCLLVNPIHGHAAANQSQAAQKEAAEVDEDEVDTDNDEACFNKMLDDSEDSEEEEEGEDDDESGGKRVEIDESDSEDDFEAGMRLAPLKKTAKRGRDEFIKPSRRKGGASNAHTRTVSHQVAKSSKKRRAH